MGIFDILFKSKKERARDREVNDVLKSTDELIERTEKMLDAMEQDENIETRQL